MLRVANELLRRKGLMLGTGTAVDATLIAAPSSTRNNSGEPDPKMKQTKKVHQFAQAVREERKASSAGSLTRSST